MRPSTIFVALFCVAGFLAVAQHAAAQDPPASAPKPQAAPARSDIQTRITIEETGGEKDTPVENASVYVKFVEEHVIKRDKKLELNVKTSREGIAHVPNAPMGRALVQVIAEGWKTYGRWLDITDPKQTIKVHLKKRPKCNEWKICPGAFRTNDLGRPKENKSVAFIQALKYFRQI